MHDAQAAALASRIKSAVGTRREGGTIRWGTVVALEPMVVSLGSGEDLVVSQACIAKVGDRVQVSMQGTRAVAIACATDRMGDIVTTDNSSKISGKIEFPNADGSSTVLGPSDGTSGTIIHIRDTTPPGAPTGLSAWCLNGQLYVSWDGTLDGGMPSDFLHVNIMIDGITGARLALAGTVVFRGLEVGTTVAVTATSEDDACADDGTPAHNISLPCPGIGVMITDEQAELEEKSRKHEDALEAVKKDAQEYRDSAEARYATRREVDEKTGALRDTMQADYVKASDASATYAEKTELTKAVNQLTSTMTSNYTSFTEYRSSNDTAVSKAQSAAANAQSSIDGYKRVNDAAVADAKAAGTTAQDQLNAYRTTNDAAVAGARKAGLDARDALDGYIASNDATVAELRNIADNAIESYYLEGAPTPSTPPASTWTTAAARKQHAGDLYIDTETGYSYRWSGAEWVQVKDSDVTKALREIDTVKTTYATKSELKATDTELAAKIGETLTTAKAYTDSSVQTEETARNAAITAKANEITTTVSQTYTRSDTFNAYQSDADGRIADAAAAAADASSKASTASGDAADAKTAAQAADDKAQRGVDAAASNTTAITQLADRITSEAHAREKTDSAVSELSSKVDQTAESINISLERLTDTSDQIHSWFDFGQDDGGNPVLTMGSSTSPIVSRQTNTGLSYQTRGGDTLLSLDASTSTTRADHIASEDVSIGRWLWKQSSDGNHLSLIWKG